MKLPEKFGLELPDIVGGKHASGIQDKAKNWRNAETCQNPHEKTMKTETCKDRYVQYGCGASAPDGWLNFDASPTLRLQRLPLIGNFVRHDKISFPKAVRFGDIRDGLPVADQSCAGAYASHVLEHLALADFEKALHETFRILRPGGVFRLIVPDLAFYCSRYLAELDSGDEDACSRFMRTTHLGKERRSRGIVASWLESLTNSKHMWMWDKVGLCAALKRHGFTDIRSASFGDSADLAFAAVEDPGRFANACAIECKRPLH